MNIETYQSWVQSLQNEIKTRQQQRKSMEQTITNMEKELQQIITKNKSLRQQNSYLAKSYENLLVEAKKKEGIINDKNALLTSNVSTGQQTKQKVALLETQKKNLQEELKQRDTLIAQKNLKLRELDTEVKKSMSLVEGYKTIVNEKAKQLAQTQTKTRQMQIQKQSMQKELLSVKEQFQAQRQQIMQRSKQSQGNAYEATKQLKQRILALQRQKEQLKDFHQSQIDTLKFNHQSEVQQFQQQISSLKNQVKYQQQTISNLHEAQKELKNHYEQLFVNKDEVVNSLINEINFLKEQKVQEKKRISMEIQETSREIIRMSMEKIVFDNKIKEFETKINNLKEEITSKDQQLLTINEHNTQLTEQIRNLSRNHTSQKDSSYKKGQQISGLKKYIQSLKNQIQTLNNQKQTLRQQFSKSLQQSQAQIQKLTIKQIELQDVIHSLTYEKSSTNNSKQELESLIKTHEFTIQKLQTLLEQSKKVVAELNSLMRTKLQEIESLENSNRMLRSEKVEWIKREEEYRKKILEYRNTGSIGGKKVGTGENGLFIRSNFRNHTQYGKSAVQSIVSPINSQNSQFSTKFSNGARHKTMIQNNWLDKIKQYNETTQIINLSATSRSNEDINYSIPELQTNQEVFSQPKHSKRKTSHSHETQQAKGIPSSIMKKKDRTLQIFGSGDLNQLKQKTVTIKSPIDSEIIYFEQ